MNFVKEYVFYNINIEKNKKLIRKSRSECSNKPLKKKFFKNIARNDDYISNCCFPNQSKFTDKCIMWYLYIKRRDEKEFELKNIRVAISYNM